MTKKYSITADLFTIPYKGEDLILYAPRVGFACIANPDLINLLADLETLDVNTLTDDQKAVLDFLDKKEVLNGSKEVNCIADLPEKYTPTQVTLFLTNKCNLRCRYCYAAAGDWKPLTMDRSIATSTIERVIENLKRTGGKTLILGFHGGGEPLYTWELVKYIVRFAEVQCAKDNLGLTVYAATNAVISGKKLQWIIKHFANLNISFDGLPHVQDYQRPLPNGKGSFEYVDRTMRFLDDHNFNYGIRSTISSYNIDLMDETIHFIGQNYKAKTVHFEPLFYCGRCKTNQLMQPDIQKFAENFIRCEPKCIPYKIKLTYSGNHVNALRNSFCGTTRDNFAVTPDGYITTCFEVTNKDDPKSVTFFIGQITEDGKIEVDEKKRRNLNALTVDKLEYCQDCFAKWHCAGDCVVKIGHEDYAGVRGHDRCKLNRQLISNHLIRLIEGTDPNPITQYHGRQGENNNAQKFKKLSECKSIKEIENAEQTQ